MYSTSTFGGGWRRERVQTTNGACQRRRGALDGEARRRLRVALVTSAAASAALLRGAQVNSWRSG